MRQSFSSDSERQERGRIMREEYELNPKHCQNCGERLPFSKRENKCCSKSCASSLRNVGETTQFKYGKGKLCTHCGEPVSERHNKYCDKCIEKRVYNKKTLLAEYTNDKARRQFLLKTREHKCEAPDCGLTTWKGQPIPLEMHHVDGDTDNNTEENLILLCRNCHGLTPTHRRKNVLKEGGRQKMRRKRYNDGQTW